LVKNTNKGVEFTIIQLRVEAVHSYSRNRISFYFSSAA
jgi:hypothetical protein